MTGHPPWLRLHAYGVGLPKTGSTSLTALLGNYRSWHEAWLDPLAVAGVARVRGDITDEEFWSRVGRRYDPVRCEFDSVTCHDLYADLLRDRFPGALFVMTYRDVRSWANSFLDLVVRYRRGRLTTGGPQRPWNSTYAPWISEGTINLDPGCEASDEMTLPALMRSWARHMHRMAEVLPPERTLWLRTADLSARVPELADFLRVPIDSIVLDGVHSNRTEVTFDRFALAPADVIEEVYADSCAGLMAAHFPEQHADFVSRGHVRDHEAWSAYVGRVDALVASRSDA